MDSLIRYKKVHLLLLVLIAMTIPASIWAINIVAEGFRVGNVTMQINAHSICKNVTSPGGTEYFVPTKTSGEWTTFLGNVPPGVVVADCVTSPASSTLTLVTSFTCPNSYGRMFCGSSYTSQNVVSADGKYIFAFENGDSGLTTPKLHVYSVDLQSKTVSLVTSLTTGLSRYDRPTAGMAVTPDGQYILLNARKYTGDGRTVPFYVYRFDGSSLQLVYSGQDNFMGYAEPAISDDASSFAVDGLIFQKQVGTSTYSKVYTHNRRGKANIWLGENKGYIIGRSDGFDWIERNASGNWVLKQSTTTAGVGNSYGADYIAVSHDKSMLAVVSKNNFSANYVVNIYNLQNGLFTKVGTINMSNNRLSSVTFSADGSFILSPSSQWNISRLLSNNIITNVTSNAIGMDIYSKIYESSSGLVILIDPSFSSNRGRFTVYQRQ